jgi:hypothetical protein
MIKGGLELSGPEYMENIRRVRRKLIPRYMRVMHNLIMQFSS